MAKKALSHGVDLDDVEVSDGVIVAIGRGSIPPPEPTVTDEVRAMVQKMDEDEPYFEHMRSSRPPPSPVTNLGDVARRTERL